MEMWEVGKMAEPRTFATVDEWLRWASSWGTADGSRSSRSGSTSAVQVTGDHQLHHVDPDKAAPPLLGTTIAHGDPTLSLLPLFCS